MVLELLMFLCQILKPLRTNTIFDDFEGDTDVVWIGAVRSCDRITAGLEKRQCFDEASEWNKLDRLLDLTKNFDQR